MLEAPLVWVDADELAEDVPDGVPDETEARVEETTADVADREAVA